jgi:hypothetical protein
VETEIRKVVNQGNSLSTISRKIDFVMVALDMSVTAKDTEDHVLLEGAPMILSDCLVELMEVRNAVDALSDVFWVKEDRAKYLAELKETVRELAGRQISDKWWDLLWDSLGLRYSEAEIEELKGLAAVGAR